MALGEANIDDVIEITGSLVGIKRNTIEEIYKLYCSHARAVGFSVRKSTTRSSIDNFKNKIMEKYYVCSSAGRRDDKIQEINDQKKRKTPTTRTGCKATLRVKLNDEDMYEIMNHVIEHNHHLTRKEWGHLHRSERMITSEKGTVIEDMINSGMRPVDSYRYMVHDAGGEECVGHTMNDHLNFVNRLKMSRIEGGDAQTVIDMLNQQEVEDNGFYFRVKLDEGGRLSNVFWRDSMMNENFQIYGDVFVFDTTYRTNRYNLICAPFVGINNHWKNVMFGCAFLSDEKTETFEWLFENFKKSMRGKCPVSLFTDQDQAITNAIEKV